MTGFVFIILFGLSSLLFPCEGNTLKVWYEILEAVCKKLFQLTFISLALLKYFLFLIN